MHARVLFFIKVVVAILVNTWNCYVQSDATLWETVTHNTDTQHDRPPLSFVCSGRETNSGCTEAAELIFTLAVDVKTLEIQFKLTFLVVSLDVVEEPAEAGLHGLLTVHPLQRGAHPFSGVIRAQLVVLFLQNTHTHTHHSCGSGCVHF